ncbi:MAG TPA: 16S rRNA (uracil(1498)-N(3))-methyltransferase, partial [Porticoccaceae bacterium]|nr:16S rRNA (uracil(1498)-N(3))-methyltransferase [Porticoccaceae bacterium]
MRIPRIFVDQSLEPHAEVVLEGAAVRHLVSALRLKPGASLVVFNGDGGEYAARLATLQNK